MTTKKNEMIKLDLYSKKHFIIIAVFVFFISLIYLYTNWNQNNYNLIKGFLLTNIGYYISYFFISQMDLMPSIDLFKKSDDRTKFENNFHKTSTWFLIILSPILILFSFWIWEFNQLFKIIPVLFGILLGAIALKKRLS